MAHSSVPFASFSFLGSTKCLPLTQYLHWWDLLWLCGSVALSTRYVPVGHALHSRLSLEEASSWYNPAVHVVHSFTMDVKCIPGRQ